MSDEAVSSVDASTSDGKPADSDKKSSGSAGRSGAGGKASSGEGGKSASGTGEAKKSESGSSEDDSKSDDSNKDGPSDDKKNAEEGSEQGSSDAENGASGGSDSETKHEEGSAESKGPPTSGDQLSLCTRAEGDCNKGLACQEPATSTVSPGRGYCSKICESDADCSGLAPEGTKYACSTGNGTRTCEVACTGTQDTSCPSGLSCIQTGRRRAAPVASAGAGGTENSDADTAAPSGVFHCRYPFEVSKTWGACGDSSHVCGEDSRCTGYWFGAGHCTHSCEADSDCEKPDSGNSQPTCVTLVPAFGDNAAVKQCALSCSAAKDGCPDPLACIEGRQLPSADGTEPMPAPAWCQ